jgi:transcriptional regulator with XRE-family HTH domain
LSQVTFKMKFTLPTDEQLLKLDLLDQDFHSQIACAFNIVYNLHGWKKEDLHRFIPGVAAEQWKRYGQQSYTKMRPAHIVAIISWLSQVSMPAILRGKKVSHYWENAPTNSINVIARASLMNLETFDFFVRQTLRYAVISQTDKTTIISQLDNSANETSRGYLAPTPLKIDDFAEDYYKSSSKALRMFRANNALTMSDMARALGTSISAYRHLENERKPKKYVDSLLAFRFKNAFKVEDTTTMLTYMEKYPEFYYARKNQEFREKIMKPLLINKSNLYAEELSERAKTLLCHQNIQTVRK